MMPCPLVGAKKSISYGSRVSKLEPKLIKTGQIVPSDSIMVLFW